MHDIIVDYNIPMHDIGIYISANCSIFHFRKAYFTQEDVKCGRKKWVKAICSSLPSTKPQCPELSDRDLAFFLMYKTDSFLSRTSITKKCAVRVTGLQRPPAWVPPPFQNMKVWVLNADVQIDEDGHIIPQDQSPYIWLGSICAARPDIFQPEPVTTLGHTLWLLEHSHVAQQVLHNALPE